MKNCIRLFPLLFIISCSNPKKISKEVLPYPVMAPFSQTEFDKQGHRGCRGLMPENTIPAMLKALDLGVTTLEMDVVITKDKKVLVSHEPWFESEITTKPDGSFISAAEAMKHNIYLMDYEEVKKYDVGMKPHPRFPQQAKMKVYKPLLSDLLDSVAEYMKTSRRPLPYFNIETKCLPAGDNIFHPQPGEFVELLMAVIKEKDIEERVIIQSFDFRTLKYLHEKYPLKKTAALVEAGDKRNIAALCKELGFMPTIYSPAYQLVNASVISDCHDKGIKIIPWTVNDKTKIEELKEMGVDGIITDYPDLFKD